MPLKIDIKKKLTSRSDRVKSVDLHPTETWVLTALYNGQVHIWDYESQQCVKSFELTDQPVRCAKFVVRKQWVVAGADDTFIRVYSYVTHEKVKSFEAHSDYIRAVAVHPTMPYVISASDDMSIKLWDWDQNWLNTQVFDGHTHYVMQLAINPKDTNTFASASLDKTIKVWKFDSGIANFTLEGHKKGVNCVDYFAGGDRPFLLSGSDDTTCRVWDYQTKSCVATLSGHSNYVTCAVFHPELPIIVTGGEDGALKIWSATTWRCEQTLQHGMERVWSIGVIKGSSAIGIGYDEGAIVLKVGGDAPIVSMDTSGKIIWAHHNEVSMVNIKRSKDDPPPQDGEKLPLQVRDLGSVEIYPTSLSHSKNGRFVVVCGDGEYTMYTALAWRNMSFGQAQECVWSDDSGGQPGDYATRDISGKIAVFTKAFQERTSFKPKFSCNQIWGGALICARSASNEFVCFYDWTHCRLIRRIDVAVNMVYWNDAGDMVALCGDNMFYILQFSSSVIVSAFAGGVDSEGNPLNIEDEGCENAFEVLNDVSEAVKTGAWVGTSFIYTTDTQRLNMMVGNEIQTLAHLDRPMFVLGYIPKENRLYLIDRDFSVVSYSLLLSVLQFQTAVMRDDMASAKKILQSGAVPEAMYDKLAHFLEAQGKKEAALVIVRDIDRKFELACSLGKLELAVKIAQSCTDAAESSGASAAVAASTKWSQISDIALKRGNLDLAELALTRANDIGGLLLFYSATGDVDGMKRIAAMARGGSSFGSTTSTIEHNLSFACSLSLGNIDECINTLIASKRIPEAALFARTYAPSRVSELVKLWKESLVLQAVNGEKLAKKQGSSGVGFGSGHRKVAEALADPDKYENMFEEFQRSLAAEEVSRHVANVRLTLSASAYVDHSRDTEKSIEEIMKMSSLVGGNGDGSGSVMTIMNQQHHENDENNVVRVGDVKVELHREEARLAEEKRLAMEKEKASHEEEQRLAMEKEKARLAEEEHLAMEKEKARQAEEQRMAMEKEKARLAEEKRMAMEKEKARHEEEQRLAMEKEKARLAEEQHLAMEKEKARQAEEQRMAMEKEKARHEEEQRLAMEKEKIAQQEKVRIEAEHQRAKQAAAAAEKARMEAVAAKAKAEEEARQREIEAENHRQRQLEMERQKALEEEVLLRQLEEEREADRLAEEREKIAREAALAVSSVGDDWGGDDWGEPDGDGSDPASFFSTLAKKD